MKRFLKVDDVVSDIEFELLQGTISRDDLAQAIRQVKSHQNKLRAEYFASKPGMGLGEFVARQFQVNDMLLTLLRRLASEQREMRLEIRKLGDMAFAGLPAEEAARGQRLLVDLWSTSEVDPYMDGWPPPEIEEAMSADALRIDMVLRPPEVPVVGGLLNRVRIALHRVSIFYVERLAARQSKANVAFGTWIVRTARTAYEQNERMRVLSDRLVKLEILASDQTGADQGDDE